MRLQSWRRYPPLLPPPPPPVKLGEKRLEIPYWGEEKPVPSECVVVFIHPAHRYYRVRFQAFGFCQSYKY